MPLPAPLFPGPERPDASVRTSALPPTPRGGPWRLLVAEDHALVREGLVALLRGDPGLEVAGVAGNSRETLALARRLRPDLVLVDYFLGDSDDGSALIRSLTSLRPTPRVLVLTLHREEEFGERALHAGANGFVSKAAAGAELWRAIAVVLAGEVYASDRLRALLIERFATPLGPANGSPLSKLSERERQVYRLVGAGETVAEIAIRLHLSVKTVASHRESLKNKLGCESAAELALRAKTWWQGIGGTP